MILETARQIADVNTKIGPMPVKLKLVCTIVAPPIKTKIIPSHCLVLIFSPRKIIAPKITNIGLTKEREVASATGIRDSAVNQHNIDIPLNMPLKT